MLNCYSPYIQFVAAIYFSMCFEQLIEKFFWNKQHREEMEKVTQKIDQKFGLTKKDNQEITVALNERRIYFIGKVKKWSILMLLLLIVVLFFSGIEQSFNICISHSIVVAMSLIILIPGINFFIQGWNKTRRYVKKINSMIDQEIIIFYQDMQACMEGNTQNEHYTRRFTQIVSQKADGDKINKDNILLEIIQKFKEDSVIKIKKIIFKN